MRKLAGTIIVFLVIGSLSYAAPAPGPVNSNLMSDVRVRQAIAYAIDMNAIIKNLMSGKAIAANSLTPNGAWKTDGLISYSYNPDKARQLLKDAHWDPNRVLDVVFYYGDQMTVDLMTAVQAYLADVGVKMTFRKLEGDLASQLWTAPVDPVKGPSTIKWDMAYAAIAALSMHEYYDRLLPGSLDSTIPANTELDDLVNATHVVDLDLQKKAFFSLQKYENATLPLLPLYYQQVFVVQNTQLDRAGAAYGNEQYSYDWNIINWNIPADSSGKKVLKTNGGPISFFETPALNPGNYMSTRVLFDHLVVADASLSQFKGQLASSFTASPDGKTISFTLRDGITWHDGSPIAAQDVKWSYENYGKVPTANAVLLTMLQDLEGWQDYKSGKSPQISGIVVTGKTVTFKFAVADSDSLLIFSQFPPLPQKFFASVDPLKFQQADFWQHPVGSGPYMLKDVSMGNYATFVPYKGYYGGAAKIDLIQMYPSTDSDTNLVKNASAHQVDFAYTKSVDDVTTLQKLDWLKVTPEDIRYTRMFFINQFPKP
jgi:peptide/nickel transport system substrate-binding protein